MKALAIRQPWAFAIMRGGKDIENRDWSTRFRGTVAIHASASMTSEEVINFKWFLEENGLRGPWCDGVNSKDLPLGGIVGLVDIIGCTINSTSPWFMGEYGFLLENPRPISLITCKGKLGFYELEPEIVAAIEASNVT
jgi:ASCH domain